MMRKTGEITEDDMDASQIPKKTTTKKPNHQRPLAQQRAVLLNHTKRLEAVESQKQEELAQQELKTQKKAERAQKKADKAKQKIKMMKKKKQKRSQPIQQHYMSETIPGQTTARAPAKRQVKHKRDYSPVPTRRVRPRT